ncbi:hypothetical protein ACA910_019831 [Epithemia clementina (nom. ined.)]
MGGGSATRTGTATSGDRPGSMLTATVLHYPEEEVDFTAQVNGGDEKGVMKRPAPHWTAQRMRLLRTRAASAVEE